MAPKVIDRIINGIIMFAIGTGVALVTLFFNSNKAAASDIQDDIDSKVSKIEFSEFKEVNSKEHTRIEQARKEDMIEFKEFLNIRFADMKEYIRLNNGN